MKNIEEVLMDFVEISDNGSTMEEVNKNLMLSESITLIRKVMDLVLYPNEKKVIELMFIYGENKYNIHCLLDISINRVTQLESRGLKKLRKYFIKNNISLGDMI